MTFSLARDFDFILSLGVTTPFLTPVMGMSCPGIAGKNCFHMLKSIGLEIWSDFLKIRDNLIGSTLVAFCEIWLGDCLRCKFRDDQ